MVADSGSSTGVAVENNLGIPELFIPPILISFLLFIFNLPIMKRLTYAIIIVGVPPPPGGSIPSAKTKLDLCCLSHLGKYTFIQNVQTNYKLDQVTIRFLKFMA